MAKVVSFAALADELKRNLSLKGGEPMTEPKNTELVSFKALAGRLGCSEAILRSLINRGEGPVFVFVGTQRKFREASIQAWLKRQERESAKALKRNRDLARKFSGV